MQSMSNMKDLFKCSEIAIISDSYEFLKKCSAYEMNVFPLYTLERLEQNNIVFSFTHVAAKRTFEIAKSSPGSKCLFSASHVFTPSVECALYSLDLMLNSDFDGALKVQREVLTVFNSHLDFDLSGTGSSAHVSISPTAKPYALLSEDIENGFIYSIAEFFEVHYAHMKALDPCPFHVDGTLSVSGILTVLRKPNIALSETISEALQKLATAVALSGAKLTLLNNRVKSFIVDNRDYVDILDIAAGGRGLNLTEFAVGVNNNISGLVRFSENSQMNEGITGVHTAIGDGSSGYHIDFLSPHVKLVAV